MNRLPRLRSLRNKLVVLFFSITAVAFGATYFYVVPQLQENLEAQQVEDLTRAARGARPTLERVMGSGNITADTLDRRVRAVADSADARLTLLGVQQSVRRRPRAQLRFFPITDSREESTVPENVTLAARAVRTSRTQTGATTHEGEELGQIAQPLVYRGGVYWVALYSRDFGDVTEAVSFIRSRVLAATGLALLLTLIGGYLVARALARRVQRLERAARQVAEGRFVEPLPVDSADELGQLTRAFNEMQVRLRQVDVARKEFVATASHELRTPIFSLGGFVELLQDEELDAPTRREFIDTMAEQVERLQKLSVDLLDLSRIDAGSLQLQEEAVDLSELAQSVIGEFRPALAEHGTELDLRMSDGTIEARCDRERVVQIVRILLDNALRHTPEGTQVTVSAERQNGAAELTVADAGPGLAQGDRVHAFERFYTGDATRGAGLGLAIAQELAVRMRGDIALESQPGATRFTLKLPAAEEAGE